MDEPDDTGWHRGLKLVEYQPQLFFTADSESVEFGAGRLTIGNRPFFKER